MVNLIPNQYSQYNQYNQYYDQPYNQNIGGQNYQAPQMPMEEKENSRDGLKKTAFVIGSWFGLNKLTDVFNKSCTNDNYEKTFIGRLGNWGDKITNKYKDNSVVKYLATKYKSIAQTTKNYIDKSPILSSMFNTPTKPECQMVTGFLESQQHADLNEAGRMLKGYVTELPKTLKEAGATKAEIEALKLKYGTGAFGGIKNQVRAIQEFQFNRLGLPEGFIDTLDPKDISSTLKRAKLANLGLRSEAMLDAPTKYEKEIIEACRRGGKDVKAFFGRDGAYKLTSPITKRELNASASYNKLVSGSKHKTALGRGLAKLPKLLMRGLTFGGGKVNSLLVAFGLGTALFNATKAPKEQKVGTAVAGGVDAVSWILSMPLAIKLMHGVNGLKNIGRSKAEVDKYMKALKKFNADVDAGKLMDEAKYNRRLKALNKLKAPKTPLKGMKKVLAKIGSCLSVALELPKPFKEATGAGAKSGATMRNLKRMLPYVGKNIIGYPLRFAIYMFAVQPVVDKVISKITSAIFGKPYEPEEEEEKAKKEAEKAMSQMAEKPVNAANNTNFRGTYPSQPIDINTLPPQNLVRQYFENKKNNVGATNGACGYDNVPRSYIPDETPVQTSLRDEQSAIVGNAINKADIAQRRAMDCLNGIY